MIPRAEKMGVDFSANRDHLPRTDIEKFRGNPRLNGALSSITAAVVGVVLNLAVWFGMHVLFPADAGFNWFAAIVGLASFIAIQWLGRSIISVILVCAILGLVRQFLFA